MNEKNYSNVKMRDNMSAVFFNAFTRKEPFTVQFGGELMETDSTQLLFELNELDKKIFQNYYRGLPEDKHKVFIIKLEYESD